MPSSATGEMGFEHRATLLNGSVSPDFARYETSIPQLVKCSTRESNSYAGVTDITVFRTVKHANAAFQNKAESRGIEPLRGFPRLRFSKATRYRLRQLSIKG